MMLRIYNTVTSLFMTQQTPTPPSDKPQPAVDPSAAASADDFHVVSNDFQLVTATGKKSLSEQKYDKTQTAFDEKVFKERYAEVHAIDVRGTAAQAIKEAQGKINLALAEEKEIARLAKQQEDERLAAKRELEEKARLLRNHAGAIVAQLDRNKNAELPQRLLITDFVRDINKATIKTAHDVDKLRGILDRFHQKIDFNFKGTRNEDKQNHHEVQYERVFSALQNARKKLNAVLKPKTVDKQVTSETANARLAKNNLPSKPAQPKPLTQQERSKPTPVDFKFSSYKGALLSKSATTNPAANTQAQASQAAAPQPAPAQRTP